MSKRPTPETDAVRAYEGNWDTKALRMTAHARKLERERDEAREKLSAAWQSLRDSQDEVLRLTFENRSLSQELDKAMEALMKIEDLFIDGTDIYSDRENMGLIAKEALEEKNERLTTNY